jgi:hypothetical protein
VRGPSFVLATALLFVTAAAGPACTRGEPPTWDAAGASTSAVPLPSPPSAGPSAAVATRPAASTEAPTAAPPADTALDPGTLPQTEDRPLPSSPALDARVAALWEGIVKDDPDRAIPAFFPVTAYEQVKDIPHPSSDWRHRLVANMKRDLHAFHAQLGDDAARARLVKLDIPDARARWVKPGEEYNKIGYWRVFHSQLRYSVDGDERAFDITSLISWRGEWYVVHVTGVK